MFKKKLINALSVLSKKRILFAFFFMFVSLGLLFNYNKRQNTKVLGAMTKIQAEQQNINDLEELLKNFPDYKDGWLQLAYYYLKEGNDPLANDALKRAKMIDSSDPRIDQLLEIINQ